MRYLAQLADDVIEHIVAYHQAVAAAANLANGTIMTEYDDAIYTLWNDNVTTPYMKGEKDLDTAIADFKAAVAAAFTNIVVE